jgi:4-amino-4-deoxy-L-arabinose transferase-like glycosyltransferase
VDVTVKSLNLRFFHITRLDALVASILGIGSLALYIRTLAPSLLFGDSAEFQTIAYTLGVGHPTGYPVYILLAKLFTFLPVGDIAYRVNLLSAVAAALTVSLVYLILRKLGAWQVPAVLSVFMLVFAELFWKHASIAEIYTTSAMCLAFILYSIFAWKESGNSRWLFAAGLGGGLSLGIHTTVALSGVAILLYLVLSTRRRDDWIQASLGVFVGIVVFLSIFLFLDHYDASAGYYNATVRHALSVWGMIPADFDSPFERLAFLYFPPQFSGQFFAASNQLIQERLQEFFSEVSWNGVIALVGVVSLFIPRKNSTSRWREAVLLLVAFITFLLFAVSYDVDDYYVFYIPAILLSVIAIGLGFSAITEMVSHLPKIPNFILGIAVVFLIVADLRFSFPDTLSSWERRIPPSMDDYEARLFTSPHTRQLTSEHIIEQVEDNAIIFTDWDRLYDFYYTAHIIQRRTEMDFHETYPQDDVNRLAESTLAYIEANINVRPIYFTERPSELASRYGISPAGAGLYQITELK